MNMKKTFCMTTLRALTLFVCLLVGMKASAQVVEIIDKKTSSEIPVAQYVCNVSHTYKVVMEAQHFHPGAFTVDAEGKKVQFAKSNMYWNGTDFHFLPDATDFQHKRKEESYIDHFYWTEDPARSHVYKNYNGKYDYVDGPCFFAEGQHFAVDGVKDVYALSKEEWEYLMFTRANASQLYKTNVTVTNNSKTYERCCIIAPDDFSGTLQSSYTLEALDRLGIVCLPAAGNFDANKSIEGTTSIFNDDVGTYFSTNIFDFQKLEILYFDNSNTAQVKPLFWNYPASIRLVRNCGSDITQNGQAIRVIDICGETEKIVGLFENSEQYEYKAVIKKKSTRFHNGLFTVGITAGTGTPKKVMFTKSNIYWDGDAFRFEEKATDYFASWQNDHVSHLYWTAEASDSYTRNYGVNTSAETKDDVPFFAQSKGMTMTVEGASGLFALTQDEYYYLLTIRLNASSLYRAGVTVQTGDNEYAKNCLIIAPDDFSGTIDSSYTIEQLDALGLVCLPAAGYRQEETISDKETYGFYWTNTLNTGGVPCSLQSSSSGASFYPTWARSLGSTIRLVQLVE